MFTFKSNIVHLLPLLSLCLMWSAVDVGTGAHGSTVPRNGDERNGPTLRQDAVQGSVRKSVRKWTWGSAPEIALARAAPMGAGHGRGSMDAGAHVAGREGIILGSAHGTGDRRGPTVSTPGRDRGTGEETGGEMKAGGRVAILLGRHGDVRRVGPSPQPTPSTANGLAMAIRQAQARKMRQRAPQMRKLPIQDRKGRHLSLTQSNHPQRIKMKRQTSSQRPHESVRVDDGGVLLCCTYVCLTYCADCKHPGVCDQSALMS